MDLTLLGIVRLVNPLQPANAWSPMDVTLLPIVTLVNPEQYRNALWTIPVTLLGIVTLVNPEQAANAPRPISVTGRLLIVAGITKSPVALGLLSVMVMVFPLVEYNNSAFSEDG